MMTAGTRGTRYFINHFVNGSIAEAMTTAARTTSARSRRMKRSQNKRPIKIVLKIVSVVMVIFEWLCIVVSISYFQYGRRYENRNGVVTQ